MAVFFYQQTSGQYYYGTVREYIRQKCRNVSVLSLSFSRFVRITLSYSYLDWYNPRSCPSCVHLHSNQNFEDEIFVRWIECNTLIPEYILRHVFRFSIVFLNLLSVFIFVLCIFTRVLYWI